MRALSFYDDELNGGFMKIEGILRVEGARLSFEFQKKDAVLEAYKSHLQEADIDMKDLDMAEFKKGLFTSKLILHAKRASVFQDLPGSELTSRTLKLKRKDRELAANISSHINLKLSEMKLRELEGDEE